MPETTQTDATDAGQASQTNPPNEGGKSVFPPSPPLPNLSRVPAQLRAHAVKPGQILNPTGRCKNVFNLQARARELGPDVFKLLIQWAQSQDFRASLPAIRMILATGFPEFEKALTSPNDVPPGFENLSIAQRLDALRQRRAELKQAEDNVRAGGSESVVPEPIQTAVVPETIQLVRPLTSSVQNELKTAANVPHGTPLPAGTPMTTAPAVLPASLLTTPPPPPAGRTRGTGKKRE